MYFEFFLYPIIYLNKHLTLFLVLVMQHPWNSVLKVIVGPNVTSTSPKARLPGNFKTLFCFSFLVFLSWPLSQHIHKRQKCIWGITSVLQFLAAWILIITRRLSLWTTKSGRPESISLVNVYFLSSQFVDLSWTSSSGLPIHSYCLNPIQMLGHSPITPVVSEQEYVDPGWCQLSTQHSWSFLNSPFLHTSTFPPFS